MNHVFKRLLALLLCVCAVLPLIGCALDDNDNSASKPTEPNYSADTTAFPTEDNSQEDNNMNEKILVKISVRDYGDIELELYPDIAPQTVYNFCSLARSGFYDGLTFHRIINGFMIQGGDPTGTGSGGPGYAIKGEFSANGVKNDLLHTRGVISMARAKGYDTAGCQFFICQQDSAHLNGQYAAFGRVLSGMEVVDAIAAVETNAQNRPLVNVVMESVTVTGPELPEPEKLPDPRG